MGLKQFIDEKLSSYKDENFFTKKSYKRELKYHHIKNKER